MTAKISIGVPYYGDPSDKWTFQTIQFAAKLAQTHTLCDIIASGVMTADHNRNLIVEEFLKSDAEWLFWIDADTTVPVGAAERMLAHGRPLVSGLYYGKNEPHPPIAYHVYNGAFTPIDRMIRWEVGEIIEVDATGMGCMLTHRSVFEEMKKAYRVFQSDGGSIHLVHKDDVITTDSPVDYVSGSIVDGYLHLAVKEPTLEGLRFPFFQIEHNRTEDMFFFDKAARLGYKPVLDSSVECGHLRWDAFTGAKYRDLRGH